MDDNDGEDNDDVADNDDSDRWRDDNCAVSPR